MIEVKGIDPKMIANNIDPYEPTHPGELIKDEIEFRGISQKKLADRMGASYTVVNDIIAGYTEICILSFPWVTYTFRRKFFIVTVF